MKKDNETVAEATYRGLSNMAFGIEEHLKYNTDLNVKNISTVGIEMEIEDGFKAIAKEVKEGFDRLIEAQSKEDLLSKWHNGE